MTRVRDELALALQVAHEGRDEAAREARDERDVEQHAEEADEDGKAHAVPDHLHLARTVHDDDEGAAPLKLRDEIGVVGAIGFVVAAQADAMSETRRQCLGFLVGDGGDVARIRRKECTILTEFRPVVARLKGKLRRIVEALVDNALFGQLAVVARDVGEHRLDAASLVVETREVQGGEHDEDDEDDGSRA